MRNCSIKMVCGGILSNGGSLSIALGRVVTVSASDGVTTLAWNAEAPDVSWVLCTDRGGALLDRAIGSCLNQTFTNFELVIIVNGPESGRLRVEIAEAYRADPRVMVYSTPIRQLTFSLNLGLHLARAPYVARMDGDDISDPQRLEVQLEFLKQNPEIAVVGSDYRRIDVNGKYLDTVRLPKGNRGIRRSLPWRNPLCHPSVMFRRDLIVAIGGYLGGRHAEDYDLWVRLSSLESCGFENLEMPLLDYNAGDTGLARRSRSAYAAVAAAQVQRAMVSGRVVWLLGAVVAMIKGVIRSRRVSN
jgi:glycosyltransferase involved in cell wall biosynthesis